jgi:hypothetical protein
VPPASSSPSVVPRRAWSRAVPRPPGSSAADADATHTRLVGLLASGGRGAAAGLDTAGFIPGAQAPWVDRRDEPCVTVDSPSTRDLDDAVGAAWDGADDGPVHVVVHIADVGRAIGVDSPADRYARVAGATAYLAVGDNAPMLDPALSEDTLSLRRTRTASRCRSASTSAPTVASARSTSRWPPSPRVRS